MDALTEVLKVLRLTSGIFLEVDFTAPWCIDSTEDTDGVLPMLGAAEHVAIYHFVTEGRCRAQLLNRGTVVELEAGDLILFPQNDQHRMGSDLRLAAVPSLTLVEPPSDSGALARIRHGGGGEHTRFVCGFLACDKRLCRPLLSALPPMLKVPLAKSPTGSWIATTIRHAATETHAPGPASEAVLSRLSELLFIEAIREYVRSLPEGQSGWFAGLRDSHVGRALALLHAHPARGWEVEALAREVGLSRSALADRFVAMIGEPPMQYLTGWRLALAAQALTNTNEAVAEVAARVGYESEAAFNRAFKREHGLPPAAWRRAARTTTKS